MGGPSRKVGANKKHGQINKRVIKRKFAARHIDQVWEDVRKPAAEVHQPGQRGPMGTTANAELDDDVPGQGKFYCIPCARYFQNAAALVDHEKTKPHKRTVKELMNIPRPHTQRDAEKAGHMGPPDNGPRLRSQTVAMAMDM